MVAPEPPRPRPASSDVSDVPVRRPKFSEPVAEYADRPMRRRARDDDDEDEDDESRRRGDDFDDLDDDGLDYRPRSRRLSADYSIDLGRWMEYGKAHWSAILGAAIGFQILSGILLNLLGFIPFLGPIAQLFLNPPIQAGLTIVCLAQLKGKNWSFGDFFSGFQWWMPLVANELLAGLLAIACMLPAVILLVIALFGALGGAPSGLIYVAIGAAVLCLPIAVYVLTRCFFFATPLIIDRGFGPIEAITGSWTLSRGTPWA
jgi:hypothetical protein